MTAPLSDTVSRRCLCCLAASAVIAAAFWLLPGEAFAQARSHIGVPEGPPGTIAAPRGPGGRVLVECGIVVSRRQITKVVADSDAAPVTDPVDMRWHFDHAAGSEWVHAIGAVPSAIARDEKTAPLGDCTMMLRQYGPARTGSDASLPFADHRVDWDV